MKKIIAFLCVLTLVLGMLAGCSSQSAPATETNETPAQETTTDNTTPSEETPSPAADEEPVTIAYWYGNGVGEQEYTDDVEAELNKILSETPGYENIRIDLVPCKDYSTDLTLALSSGTQVDLISTFDYGAFDKVDLGEYLPLDDYVAANPEITAELPDWFVEYGKKDGTLYFIPNYQQMANTIFWGTPVEYIDAAGYTTEEVTEIIQSGDIDRNAALEKDLLQAARDMGKDAWFRGNTLGDPRRYTGYSNVVMNFNWNSVLYYDPATEDVKWADDTDWMRGWFKYAAEFLNDGTSYPDDKDYKEYFGGAVNNWLTGDHVFSSILTADNGTSEMVCEKWTDRFGLDMYASMTVKEIVMPPENAAGGVAIAANSAHPEEAAKVLALLFNSKYDQFYNTLCWGIEGIHYNKLGDDQIETLEFEGSQGGAETTYCYHKWRGGNTFNAWNNQSLTEEQEQFILTEINEGSNTVTTLSGFIFDKAPVQTQIEQCTAVSEEYRPALGSGVMGDEWESYYEDYISKMEQAGVREVVEEYNSQLNAFLGR